MLFNKRVDQKTDPFVDTTYFNKALNGTQDHIYITFLALPDNPPAEAWQDGEEYFLQVPLPYETLTVENAREVMKEALLEHLKLLTWLELKELYELVASLEQ